MAQSSLCLVLLFSAFTIASAVPNPQPSSSDLECSEVDRQRYSDECKITRCRVKELCYDKRLDTWLYRHRNVITCESLECLNGGTPILPYKRGNGKTRMLHTDCEVGPPFCQCPTGFSGRCCEDGDSDICATVYCLPGTVCIIECTGSPCIPEARCVPTDKPGTCPADYTWPGRRCHHECEKDCDCEGTKKCCGRFCSRVCLEPEEKPGTCPADYTWPGRRCHHECERDWDCEGTKKCCGRFCSRVCLEPEEKPGTCPADYTWPGRRCHHECERDWDCEGTKKCCGRFCSRVCLEPEEKPGTCPAAYTWPGRRCHHQCETDWDCEGAKKCCGQFCSRVCLKPEDLCGGIICPKGTVCDARPPRPMCLPININKPGTCPRDRYARELTKDKDSCSHDRDCPGDKKCCGSDRFCCVDPELPGSTCPRFPDTTAVCVTRERCVYDHQCPAGHKCCHKGCGHGCVRAEELPYR